MNELLTFSGVAQGRLIETGEVSSRELVQSHLDQIAKVNPAIHAAVDVMADQAVQAAEEADRRRHSGERRSPFDGVPFSIKDSIAVKGAVVTAGTLGWRDAVPCRKDATLVSLLRAAGAIPLARTNLPDLLFSFESDNLVHGRTSNPYDLSRTAGGSSGGEAALIAACGSPFGLGSDAAGSVRVPAHCCGIASLKPTSGRLPRTGHVPAAAGWVESVWQMGPMARRVDDLCALLPLLAQPDGLDRTMVPMPCPPPALVAIPNLRVAYFISNGDAPTDPETEKVVRRVARVLQATEARPPAVQKSYELEMKFLAPDGGEGLRAFVRQIGSDRTHPLLESWIEKHAPFCTDLAGFARIWAELDNFRAQMHQFLSDFDVLLSPVAAQPAWPHGLSAYELVFRGFAYTMTYNLTGWPAAVVRCGETTTGLPIGVQIAAAPWREDIVLAVAKRLEDEFGGWQAPPILDAIE